MKPPPRPWYAAWFDATYLDLYGHRDEAEAEHATEHLLAPLGLAGRRVLDLACGAGRHLRALQRRGARVVGLDLSADLLGAARAAGLGGGAGLVRADLRQLPFRSAAFDLVLSMFTSFGYFATADEDRTALGEAARVLAPGGVFVLDFLNAARVRRDLVPFTERRLGDTLVRETRRLDAAGERIVKEIEIRAGDAVRTYREEVRLWTPEALAEAGRAAGLVAEAIYGGYEAEPFDAATSPRCILRARREA